jgi:hypothetical protein
MVREGNRRASKFVRELDDAPGRFGSIGERRVTVKIDHAYQGNGEEHLAWACRVDMAEWLE